MIGEQNLNSIGPLVFKILFFKLILICKFHNVPCALGFEVKYSQFFCRNFRTYIIIVSRDFTINNLLYTVCYHRNSAPGEDLARSSRWHARDHTRPNDVFLDLMMMNLLFSFSRIL